MSMVYRVVNEGEVSLQGIRANRKGCNLQISPQYPSGQGVRFMRSTSHAPPGGAEPEVVDRA